jgi:hypothetical protein
MINTINNIKNDISQKMTYVIKSNKSYRNAGLEVIHMYKSKMAALEYDVTEHEGDFHNYEEYMIMLTTVKLARRAIKTEFLDEDTDFETGIRHKIDATDLTDLLNQMITQLNTCNKIARVLL